MRTFTIDTSCVIHAVQDQSQALAVDELLSAARRGNVRLFLTAAFDADMSRASVAHLGANLRWLAAQPIVTGLPGPFRLDYSVLGGSDVLVSEEQGAEIAKIEQIVLPPHYQQPNAKVDDAEFMDRWRRKINDVQHISAHLMAGHDAFVTTDEGDILRKRARLRSEVGVAVLSIAEACSEVEQGVHNDD